MKLYINVFLLGLCCFFNIHFAWSQFFSKAEQSVILPSQVMFENYTIIQLPVVSADGLMFNQFDRNNPYTYLQLIKDGSGGNYQVLFQTDFFGKIYLLAYSNNLHRIFGRNDKPLLAFKSCIKHVNKIFFTLQNTEAAINCILERLNYCSE